MFSSANDHGIATVRSSDFDCKLLPILQKVTVSDFDPRSTSVFNDIGFCEYILIIQKYFYVKGDILDSILLFWPFIKFH